MVMGPTPPGTGVIAPGDLDRRVEIDVANQAHPALRRAGPVVREIRLMPTSITVAPGAIQSPGTMRGRPTARRPGYRRGGIPRRGSRVREWAIVHRAVLAEQQLRHRFADDVGAAEHEGAQPLQRAQPVLQHRQAAARRARRQRLAAGRQPAGVDDVEAVDILVRVDGVEHGGLGDAVRQRQLHQDAMDGGIVVQAPHQREQRFPVRIRRQLVLEGVQPGLDGRPALVADIDLARRILADQHDGEAGRQAVVGFQRGDLAGDGVAEAGGEGPCRR